MSAAPRLALLDGATRTALATNERARHEPSRSGEYARLAHPAGCGCCSPDKRSATVRAANGNKAFPGKRPWMISH
jgi:hypothetical protein